MRSVERLIPAVVTLVALAVALVASAVSGWYRVHDERASAADDVRAALISRVRGPSIASVKTYGRAGEILSDDHALPLHPPLYDLAARIDPPEVTCSPTASGTVCVETTPAPLAIRLRSVLSVIAVSALLAIAFGIAAGVLLARLLGAPLHRIAGVLDRVAHDRAYSLRVDPAPGDLGRVANSVNALLTEIQERDMTARRRAIELEAVNKDLEAFAYSVSHDLRAPLGSIDGFTQALEMDYGHLYDETAREYISWVREGCRQMRELIDGLLQMARLSRAEVQREAVDLSSIAHSVADALKQTNPTRPVRFDIRDGVRTVGDERLLRAVMENLMGNAWKFTRNRADARIEFGQSGGAYYVRDNGAGFDPSHAAKMFRPFQRLHSSREFEGTGIGLATVQKIVEKHGGRAWAEGEVEKGATIYFTTATADEVVHA